MADSIINEKNIEKADVVLLSAGYEKTASSHKGTARGPAAVVKCLDTQIEFFDREFKTEVNHKVKIAHKELRIEKLLPEQAHDAIHTECEALIKANKFIFMLGGEHAVSIGHFEALAKKYNPKDVTIMQIDAHCDLRHDDSDYNPKHSSDFAHSTVMNHAGNLGFPLVQVGIRTYSREEYEYFSNSKNNVTVFEWNKGSEQMFPVEKILKSIKTKYLYITIDVDGFDPSVMPGTGTPVQGGLSWYYGVDLIQKAIKKCNLIGADVVEVSPVSDSVLTEYGAAQLAYTMLAQKFAKRLK